MFDRLDDATRKTLGRSYQEAMRLQRDYIGVEHILLGLLPGGAAAYLLRTLGVDLEGLRDRIEERAGRGEVPVTATALEFTTRAKKAWGRAAAVAAELGENRLTAVHFLLGLLAPATGGAAAEVLASAGIGFDAARAEAARLAADPALLKRARAFNAHLPGASFELGWQRVLGPGWYTVSYSRSGLTTIAILLLLVAAVWYALHLGWLRIH